MKDGLEDCKKLTILCLWHHIFFLQRFLFLHHVSYYFSLISVHYKECRMKTNSQTGGGVAGILSVSRQITS